MWIATRDMAIHPGRSRSLSPALSLISTRTSSGEIIEDEGLVQVEIPPAENLPPEPILENYPVEVPLEVPPDVPAAPIDDPWATFMPTPATASKKKKKMGKKSYYAEEPAPPPAPEPDF